MAMKKWYVYDGQIANKSFGNRLKGVCYMSSKWVEFRDAALKELKVEAVTEAGKQEFTRWTVDTLLPLMEEAADKFVGQLVEDAANETGWCKVRDLIVLPALVRGGLWLVKTTLTKTAAETVK